MSFSSWYRGLSFNNNPIRYDNWSPLEQDASYSKISDTDALAQGYMSSSAFYTVINNCATGVSSLPLSLMRETSSGKEEILSGDAYNFIFNPNSRQTLQEYWEELCIYYFTNGEFFSYRMQESIGFLNSEIVSLPPELMTVNSTNRNSILGQIKNYTFQDGGQQVTIQPEDMLHVYMTNPSVSGRKNKNGLSPLQAGQRALSTSNQIELAGESYFKNGGSKVIISGSADQTVSLQTKDRDAINAAFKSINGGAHRMNQAHITGAPITVNTLSAPSTDMQMIENSLKELRKLAALVGLPAIIVGDMANSTYANYATAVKEAYTSVYIPTAKKFIEGYNRTYLKTISDIDNTKYTLEINEHKIAALIPSPLEKAKEIRDNVASGLISRNEGRVELGREELPIDEMDIPTVQSSTTLINTIDNGEAE